MSRSLVLMAAAIMAVVAIPSFAQGLRDPTLPPETIGPVPSMSPGQRAAGIDRGAFSIIVRDGIPSLVVGTRSYTQGQKWGNATIERIAETEVWLREGRVLRKVSQFPGIERRAVPVVPAKDEMAAASSRTVSKSRKPGLHCDKSEFPNVSCATDKP